MGTVGNYLEIVDILEMYLYCGILNIADFFKVCDLICCVL